MKIKSIHNSKKKFMTSCSYLDHPFIHMQAHTHINNTYMKYLNMYFYIFAYCFETCFFFHVTLFCEHLFTAVNILLKHHFFGQNSILSYNCTSFYLTSSLLKFSYFQVFTIISNTERNIPVTKSWSTYLIMSWRSIPSSRSAVSAVKCTVVSLGAKKVLL